MSDWKPELEAIIGARHGGQISAVLTRLKSLDTNHPHEPAILFQIGWTLDILERSAEAAEYYDKAIALGLSPLDHCAALVGLGNSLRLIGQTDRSIAVLTSAREQFPDYREIDAYLSLALHDAGQATTALQLLMNTLLETTDDIGLSAHQRALRHHAMALKAPV